MVGSRCVAEVSGSMVSTSALAANVRTGGRKPRLIVNGDDANEVTGCPDVLVALITTAAAAL